MFVYHIHVYVKVCEFQFLSFLFHSIKNLVIIIKFFLFIYLFKKAAKIIRSLDETVEPCEDFYQFVCGQWLESTIIPEHKPLENKFDELHDILNRQVRG